MIAFMSEKAKKTILVTGGAGFIGSNLIERLVQDPNNRVVSLDNYFTGKKENHIPGAEYIEGHTKDIAKLINFTPDLVYHLGEYSRVAKSLEEPELVWDLNIAGTLSVLEFWRKTKCKLVYAGSSTKFVSARDDGVEGRDLSPYTWAKAINSELVHNYGRWYDLPYSTTYFYNVYGHGERGGVDSYGTVIETFKQNFLNNRPHEVRMPGTQTRAFTHVNDTIDALLLVGEKGVRDEYAVSSQDVCSLLDVVNMFGGDVAMLPQTKTSRSSGAMDTAKLEALGWKQKQTLEDYIRKIKEESSK
ncbi:MAG: ADP-L-glycero-D-mannoheptose-6-epimerase [Parcubacteria group bacterium GW2011_GWA1_47_8]|nr:MAG: ADP-L-glycero-D-mannoheptose-6-epimerase [Parcubacteria group bacterium GW2011_GWA1_47_8]